MPLFETFPYTNFHDLNLDWILRIVKKMDDVVDNINETIHNIVLEELDNINLEKIILDTVTKYGLAINVVAPPNELNPADPTGEKESTETIQGCIDYANSIGGGVVFFPAGRYLTGSLTLKNNVSLVGFDQYTTRITLKGGATAPLISGDVQNCYIGGLTLDGNAEVQVEDITVLALTCNNCGFNNIYTTSGFILMAITGSGGLVWGDKLRFGTCVQNAFVSIGSGRFRFTNMYFENLSSVGGVNVININTDGGLYDFRSVANCTTCCDISGNYNIVHAVVENATNKVVDNGEYTAITSYRDILKAAYENYSLYVKGDLIVGSETADIEIESNNTHFEGNDVKFNQTNPITYRTPTEYNRYFNSIPMKDGSGEEYNVLVANGNTPSNVNVVNVMDFGAKGDGVTDDTAAIQAAIDWCVSQKKGYSILITGGTFLISDTIDLWYDYNSSLIIQGAIVKATKEMDFMISVGYRKTSAWLGYYPYGIFGQGVLDCNNLAGGIVMNPERVYTHVENIQIRNCEKVGISIGLSTDSRVFSSQYTIFNVGIYGNGETNAGNGIEDYHGDGFISNCFIYYKRIAIKSRAATYINNVHIWGGDGTFVGKPYEQEIIGVWASTSVYLSDMYFDSTPIGIYLSDGCECQCSNIMFMSEYDFVMTCFNANYDCTITVDALNIQNFNVTTFNPLFLRSRPSANYFIGLKRFRCTLTEKLTINYKAIVFNEFNNLVVNPYVTTLERNYSALPAGYTLIGYLNAMRSRVNMKIEFPTMSYFDFSVSIASNGTSANILRNESVKYGDEDITIEIGKAISNDYGSYLPVYVHAAAESTSKTVSTNVIVDGTQNAGFYPITTGALNGKENTSSITSILSIPVPPAE